MLHSFCSYRQFSEFNVTEDKQLVDFLLTPLLFLSKSGEKEARAYMGLLYQVFEIFDISDGRYFPLYY